MIARTHNIKQRKSEVLLHGWDYEKMMELWSWDEDNFIYFNENDFTENDEYLSTSTQSSTTDISEDTISAQEIESNLSDEEMPYDSGNRLIPELNEDKTIKKIHSYQDTTSHSDHLNMEQDPTPNEVSLNQCQNLNEHLNLPNVIEAVAIGTSENMRFKQRASQRPRTGPNNYATYHRTGNKHPSSQTTDTWRGER